MCEAKNASEVHKTNQALFARKLFTFFCNFGSGEILIQQSFINLLGLVPPTPLMLTLIVPQPAVPLNTPTDHWAVSQQCRHARTLECTVNCDDSSTLGASVLSCCDAGEVEANRRDLRRC